jgi:short-chain fatty acids transporter
MSQEFSALSSSEPPPPSGPLGSLQNLGIRLTGWTERWVPDAWVVALLLTLPVFLAAIIWGDADPFDATKAWGEGIWSLLELMAQFSFAIVVAFAVATAPPVSRALNRLASVPNSDKPWQALLLMAAFAFVTGWINWAVTIVASAVFVPYIAKNNPKVDYRLLVTAAYLGIGTIWHAGLSSSAALIAATPGNFLIENKILSDVIPVNETIFTTWNIIMSLLVAAVGMAIIVALSPPPERALTISAEDAEKIIGTGEVERPQGRLTPAERMEWWPGFNIIFGAATAGYFVYLVVTLGFEGWTIDTYNLLFLSAALWLHFRPRPFLNACERGVRGAWGVLVVFPFFAGIFGMVQFTKLGEALADLFASIASTDTFAPFVYWYSGILNYFVPSGGAKFAIEAPYILPAGDAVGFSHAATTMAYAWGDMMSDMIQPFWAIALLAIVRLRFGQIMGYCVVVWIAFLIVTTVGMFLLPANLGR